MRWIATICWYRDEAYDMEHANEVECNYLLVAEMKHMRWCMLMRWIATICWYRDEAYDMEHANEVECNYLLVQR